MATFSAPLNDYTPILAGSAAEGIPAVDLLTKDAYRRYLLANGGAGSTGGTGGSAATTLPLASANFSQNAYDLDMGTYRKRSAFAVLKLQSSATSLALQMVSDYAAQGPDTAEVMLNVYVNGIWNQAVVPDAVSGVQTKTITLPAGDKEVAIVEGGAGGNTASTFFATSLTQVVVPAGSTGYIVAPTKKTNGVFLVHDSIGVGDGSTNDGKNGLIGQLRSQLSGWDVISDGWNARYNTGSYATAALQEAQAQRIVNALTGYSGRKVLYWQVLTNDFGYVPGQPSGVSSILTTVIERVHALDASIEIKLQTPIWRGNKDVPNSLGLVLSDYAAVMTNVAAAHSSYTVRVDALPWLTAADLTSDQLHPTDAGYEKLAGKVAEELTVSTPVISATRINQGETVQETDSRIRYAGPGWTQLPGHASAFGNGIKYTQTISGTSFAFDIVGYQFALGYHLDAGGGPMEVLVNGAVVGTYSAKAPTDTPVPGQVYTSPVLTTLYNTVTVRAQAGSTAGYIWCDQVAVLTTAAPQQGGMVLRLSDNFARANGDFGPSYFYITNVGNAVPAVGSAGYPQIVSGRLRLGVGNNLLGVSNIASTDFDVAVDIALGNGDALSINYQTLPDAVNYYGIIVNQSGASQVTLDLYRKLNNVPVKIGTAVRQGMNADVAFRLRVLKQGGQHSISINGEGAISVVDTSIQGDGTISFESQGTEGTNLNRFLDNLSISTN
ncbi:SGNH/GDSL hydrolase family protein [Hymenobacter sp. BT491]|uniref:SGNH/GDSL hydrolase family protein n=1 Tax=Hymenobacter sp. BT491 TaxID=2766779 RepID=UPI0016536B47|nr:SGNH/GDSL hydrolase family protein [Hymenobacter sp. BT491]MBC6988926.1 hypothetical protein [Hymenobacter sp. BT491]